MKKVYGFTLIEIMISIFIFSSGMMAFMAYHARANSMIFETESSQIAHSIALNLIEEINSMTPARFSLLADKERNSSLVYDSINSDSALAHLFDQSFVVGPFDAWGKPLGGTPNESFMFYRMIKITTYGAMTDAAFPATSQFSRLRHVEVITAWPKKASGSVKCSDISHPNDCNYLYIPLVKFVDVMP